MGVSASEVRVGDDGRQRRGVALGDALGHNQTLDQIDLLLVGKMNHK